MIMKPENKPKCPDDLDKVGKGSQQNARFTPGGATRAQQSNEQEEVHGVARAIRMIDEEKRRPGHKNILLETDKLVRLAKKAGTA